MIKPFDAFHYEIVIGRTHYYKTSNSEILNDFNTQDVSLKQITYVFFYLCFKVSKLNTMI